MKVPRVICVMVGLMAVGSTALAQPDSSSAARRDVETSFKFYPTPIWSRSAGFSAGAGYTIENLLIPTSRLLATAKPGQHRGRYTLTYFVRDAFRDPVYGLLNAYYETAGRKWYYGLGPASSEDDEVAVELETLQIEARFGIQPYGRRVLLQPSVKYLRYDVGGYRSFEGAAIERLSPQSFANLRFSAGETPGSHRVREGFAVGSVIGLDLRDRPMRTRNGLLIQASAYRYRFATEPRIEFDRYEIYAYAFIPVGVNVLMLRLVTKLTQSQEAAPIPFYLLPSLHGRLLPGYVWNRFYGQDLFVATVEYAAPLFQLMDFAAMDLLVTAGVGSVYNDLFDEFKPSITFDAVPERGPEFPLRPSIALGLDLDVFSGNPWSIRGLLSWGTDGFRLARFGFVHDLRLVELGAR